MKRYVREELPPFPERGMSEERFRSLLGVRNLERASLKELAAHDGLSASAQCIMMNRLVAEGFARRTADSTDRRVVYYELTESGLVLLNQEIARRTELLGSVLGKLSANERTRIARAVDTLLAAIVKLRGVD